MSRGDSKEKAIMGAVAPKPPLAIPPHSKLWGFLAFSHEPLQPNAGGNHGGFGCSEEVENRTRAKCSSPQHPSRIC